MFRLAPSLSSGIRSCSRSVKRKLEQSLRLASSAGSEKVCNDERFVPEKPVKEIQIPVPWGHISGKWWGSTECRPLVALHGYQDNANTWDRLVPLLNVNSVLAIDMVGHGRSSHYPVGQCYHYIDDVVNLRRIVQYYGWDKVSLIGHSIGSSIGFVYSGYYPEEVDKFISVDCIRGVIRQEHSQLIQDIRAALESNLRVEQRLASPPPGYKYEDIVDLYLQGTHGSLTRESCKIILERGLSKLSDDRYYFSRDPRIKLFTLGFFDEDFLKALASQITCEVLSIRGLQGFSMEGSRQKVYLETLALVEKSAKRFRHVDVEGTHHLHLNTPERIAGAINEFLAPNVPEETPIY